MNALQLAMERERLVARSGRLREQVAEQSAALAPALKLGDCMRDGAGWVRQHPALVVAAMAVVVIVRPGTAWRWSRRAWSVWQLARRWQRRLGDLSRD